MLPYSRKNRCKDSVFLNSTSRITNYYGIYFQASRITNYYGIYFQAAGRFWGFWLPLRKITMTIYKDKDYGNDNF